MIKRFMVEGTMTGANGVDYGKWLRHVEAATETDARTEAVRIVKAQSGATAHICIATNVTEIAAPPVA